jgi:cytochrome c553
MTTTPRCPVLLLTTIVLIAAASTHAGDYVDQRQIRPIRGDAAAGAAKAAVCMACHGPNGNAIVPTFPRLAGQRADYLYYRLLEFKQADTKLPYYAASPMPVQAKTLSDADMRNVAAYFAAQVPTASPGVSVSSGGKGEKLFREGNTERGIPPCQGCHGAKAEGGPIADGNQYLVYPALHGQHAPYLVARLHNYRYGWPHHASGDFIMAGVAHTLDEDSIRTIAAYLASIPP